MSVYADLHAHTTTSDGQMTLDDVPQAARDAGVEVVAITDHDRIHPELDEVVTTRDGITILRCIELRVKPAALDERIDLLGYGVNPTDALQAEIDRLQTDRAERAQRIIDAAEDYLGVTLGIEGRAGMGRPHIARAIADHSDTDVDYGGAFDEVIGYDCPAYSSRNVTSFADGAELLSEACGLVGLAHPYRYDDTEGALELARHLDACEVDYPYDAEVDTTLAERIIDEEDLVQTGGSDAHDHTLGLAGLSEVEYERFSAAAGL